MSFNKKFILKFGAFSTLELITNQGLGLISFMILTRVLPKEEMGIWILFLASTTLLELGRGSLIKNALIKYLASSDTTDAGLIQRAALGLGVFFFIISIGLILFPLAFFVSPMIWDTPILTEMFLWYIPSFFLLIFYSQFKNIQHANFDFKASFIGAMSRRITLLLLIIAVFLYYGEIELMQLVFLQMASIIVCTLVAFIQAKKYWIRKAPLNRAWVTKLFRFGIFTFGTTMSAQILRNIDRYMLGAFYAKGVVAVYDACIRITNLIEIPTNAMSTIVFPKSASLSKEKNQVELKQIYEKSVAIIFTLVIPIVVVVLLFPEVFLLIIGGEKYLFGVDMLRVTILFALFVPFIRQSGTVLDSIGKPYINFYLTLFAGASNVIMNYLFIREWGAIGAAYGTLTTYGFILILNQIFLNRYLGVNIFNVIRLIFVLYWQGMQLVGQKLKAKTNG